MLLIRPKGTNNPAATGNEPQPPPAESKSGGGGGRRKKAGRGGAKKKKFTSLIVACLKRLIQIGINFFEGKEQELIQIAKQKFVDIKTGNFAELKLSAAKTKALQNAAAIASASQGANEDDNIELTGDQEAIVEDFINKYMKTFENVNDMNVKKINGVDVSEPQIVFNEAMDKDTYQKTKWQRMLYRKIASKRHMSPPLNHGSNVAGNGGQPIDNNQIIIMRIMEISKVLYGMHMVEHPPVKSKGEFILCFGPRRILFPTI